MTSTTNTVHLWKETFRGFVKVKAFVVFAYGSIVVFEESPGTQELTQELAIDQLKKASNKDYFTSLRTKGRSNKASVYIPVYKQFYILF